jgi:type I restriction enzyme S subunit
VIDTAYYVKPKTELDMRWLYYAIVYHKLGEIDDGSPIPSTTRAAVYVQDVAIPPLPEQREIAAILGALDDKIELNRKMAATLEAMARALYRSWFVDFDPVTARAEGRAPAHMPPATAALFPDRFGEDGLPEGWSLGILGDLIAFNPRETLKKGTPAPYLDMKALPTSGLMPEAPILREFASGTKFRSGDTLLARITPCLENGKTALVDDLGDGIVGWGSTEFIVMRAKPGIPHALPYCVARDATFRGEAIATMTGSSGRQRANEKRIAALKHAVPPQSVIEAFAQMSTPWIEMAQKLGRQSRTLATLRDTLLPRLMSGELRVPAARDIVRDIA